MNPLTAIRGAVCVSTPAIRRQPFPTRAFSSFFRAEPVDKSLKGRVSLRGYHSMLPSMHPSYVVKMRDRKFFYELLHLTSRTTLELLDYDDPKFVKDCMCMIREEKNRSDVISLDTTVRLKTKGLLKLIDAGDEEILRILFENGAKFQEENGPNPLLCAIYEKQMGIASLILKYTEYNLNGLYSWNVKSLPRIPYTHKISPLALAILEEDEETFFKLVRMGASLNEPLMSEISESPYLRGLRDGKVRDVRIQELEELKRELELGREKVLKYFK